MYIFYIIKYSKNMTFNAVLYFMVFKNHLINHILLGILNVPNFS